MWEYNPIAHDYQRVFDFAHLCGWNERGVGDSKIHGDIGVMPDGSTLVINLNGAFQAKSPAFLRQSGAYGSTNTGERAEVKK